MNSIQVKKEFNASLNHIFDLLSKHSTYNIVFAPAKIVRVQDAVTPEYPDGLGSIRRVGLGAIQPLQEQITAFQFNQRIEYKIIHNILVEHHLGILEFEALSQTKTLVTYTIELKMRVPFLTKRLLQQLSVTIQRGFSRLEKSL